MKNNLFRYIYLPQYTWLIGIIFVCLGLSSYIGYLTPRLISNLYESFKSKEDFDIAYESLLSLFIFGYVNRVIYQISINKYVQQLLQNVRSISYKNWLLNYEVIQTGKNKKDKFPLGEVMARIMSDSESVRELVTTGSFAILIDFAFIISCLISFLELNTTSGYFLIIAELLACFGLIWGSKYMARIFMLVRTSTGWLSRVIADVTAGMRQIYYTPHGNYTMKKGEWAFDDFLRKQLRANVWDASYYSIAESLYPILLALLIVVFPYSQITEVAVLAAIIDLIQRSIGPIKDVAGKTSNIQRAKTGFQRMNEFNNFLSQSPSSNLDSSRASVDFQKLKVSIQRFEYIVDEENEKNFCLEDIQFEGNKGQLIGLVGLSGSGKSTILKILSTQILTDKCHIEIYGEKDKLFDYTGGADQLSQYKEFVSLVSQDSHIFSESLRYNITMGHEGNFDVFWHEMENFLPYLSRWGVKPDSKISPQSISLGQKQLISSLRSCYLKKTIVLFDEISSGLDSELESALRKMVLYTQKHSLTIIVAHRLETIREADNIVVLHDGKIESSGTHNALLKKSKTYKQFMQTLNQDS